VTDQRAFTVRMSKTPVRYLHPRTEEFEMRYTLRALGAVAVLAVGWLLGASGVAQAGGADEAREGRLYAPSALVLTIGKGDDAATASVQRAVLLSCTPRPVGTHPAPAQACWELRAVDGEFAALTGAGDPGKVCTKIWDPVVTTADGVWEGRRVSWSQTFANPCVMEGMMRGSVFAF
jgi:hypothetical protein